MKEFPEARQADKETPYNERRKMGHFSWTISKSLEKTVVNLYIVHKVSKDFTQEIIKLKDTLKVGQNPVTCLCPQKSITPPTNTTTSQK